MSEYISYYNSPLGQIMLAATDQFLTGLWFVGQKYFGKTLSPNGITTDNQIITETKNWLDAYFRGIAPTYTPPLAPHGTEFQTRVWAALIKIPYGHTTTYGNIAKQITPPAHPRAVGSAIAHNPISIIIPCHRVVGTSGNPTGYAGGIDKKMKLLELEHINSPQ